MHRSVRTTVAIVAAVAIIYTLAGFLLAPYWVKRQIIDALSERTGGEVTVGQLSVNPFVLSADLRQLNIDTPDYQPYFTVEGVQARLDIASLWSRGWIIREMILDSPHLRASALPEGLNESGSDPRVAIKHLQIKRGRMQWISTTIGTAAADAMVDLTGLEFTLENLEGDPSKPGQFILEAVVNHSGWLKSSGRLSPFPGWLDATAEFGGFNLADLDSMMPVDSDSGQVPQIFSALLSGKVTAHFEDGRTTIRGQAELDQLELVDRSNRAAVFSATNVQATNLAIQSSPFRASVEVLHLNKPHLRLVREADGTHRGSHWLKPLFNGSDSFQPAILQIEILGGLLDLTDQSLESPYQVNTDRVEGSIKRDDSATTVSVVGRVNGGSTSVLNAHRPHTGPNGNSSLDISVENLDAAVLSPYLAELTGREITSGQLDLSLDYTVADQQFKLKNEISALGFQLDEMRANPASDELPLDLAAALVRDDNDQIKITIPVPPGRVDQNMQLGSLVSTGFVNLVQRLSSAPFRTLGRLAGGAPPHLERILFDPGATALAKAAESKLAILASALLQRPGLGLKVNGRFDTVTDRQALARKQVRLHVTLAASAGPPGREAPVAIDFDNTKVISVLDEFAGERLSGGELSALRASHPQQDSAFYAAVFEALVKNEAVSRTALKSLARYRAQTIVDQLKAAGVDPERLQIGTEIEAEHARARAVTVELEIVLL